MLKFNSLLLTLALGVFSLFLSESEGDLAYKKITPSDDLKIDHSFNAFGITTSNAFEHITNFEFEKEPTNPDQFYAINPLNKAVYTGELQYLKDCDFIDLNLTTRAIIYPFHSFL
ncbi:hypothetical protein [Mariniflexile sp. AS56]|uniref:hypothetical protein n=1 Tax=Mariniflexile sp. AS56 TaxID=3063957 RepID=UPI0026EC7633|nr:hypothetical protein [Mariniflexile sp. AS56]MDO7172292.1 hypothetical protein [Mariniflexile sp. AS56]